MTAAPADVADRRAAETLSAGDAKRAPRVIVSADDFGSFACVSRGIVDAARDGVVRATSVLATSPGAADHVPWLAEVPHVDVGVHLTLTHGRALSPEMQAFEADLGRLRPARIAVAVTAGTLPLATVRAEWRAQIERCSAHGLRVTFLNSHEHVHGLPALFRVACELARDHGIRFVRTPAAAVPAPFGLRAVARGAAFALLGVGRVAAEGPGVLGLHEAGRLCAADVERMFAQVRPGGTYELVCHPGRKDAGEVRDARLLAYHDWDGERELLTGGTVPAIAARHGVELVGFRDL